MFFFITYYLLEVLFGTTYWVLCKTSKGIYYLIWGRNKKKLTQNINNDLIVLSKEEDNSKTKLQEALNKIKNQEKSLNILHNKLDKLLMKESNCDNYVEIVNKND
tara:strand:+ start:826 stop:1140 length:315 start_codon:yes stop_codon:yes gene_type:complete